MAHSDTVLFNKWCSSRDADAFAELLSRHGGMVYGACLRVVKNPSIAEEVSQECFLELMKGPRGVRSIGAWLHTVATRRALDRVKAEGRRSAREQAYASTLETSAETTWDDTRAFVDEAIAELPDELQLPIVLRFLEGRTHEAIAEELGVPRSTVRSRIDRGIGVVRENLQRRGVVLATGTLATALESVGATPAPTALVSELGRRALAMRGGASFLAAAGGAKIVALPAALAALVVAVGWLVFRGGEPPEEAQASANSGPVAAAVAAVPVAPTAPPSGPAPDPPEAPAEVDQAEAATVAPETEKSAADGWKLDLTPSEEVLSALQKTVNLEFQDIHIKDIVEFVQDSFDVNIVLDGRVVARKPRSRDRREDYFPHDYVTDGMVRKISLQDKTIEEALAVITTMLNLTYKARGNFVWISSSSQITEDLTVPLPSAPFSEGEMIKKVSGRVNVEFEDIHLARLLGFLEKSFEIPIVIDNRVVMPPVEPGEEPVVLPSHTTDGMLDYINLKDAPMGEALFVMTKLLDLTYRLGDDGIYISTPNKVREDF